MGQIFRYKNRNLPTASLPPQVQIGLSAPQSGARSSRPAGRRDGFESMKLRDSLYDQAYAPQLANRPGTTVAAYEWGTQDGFVGRPAAGRVHYDGCRHL
jgi:hypothetical protein